MLYVVYESSYGYGQSLSHAMSADSLWNLTASSTDNSTSSLFPTASHSRPALSTAAVKSLTRPIEYTQSRVILTLLLLGRCLESLHLVRFIQAYRLAVYSMYTVLPGVVFHLVIVLYTVMHVYACVGVAAFPISPQLSSDASTHYDVLNFRSYPHALFTLFNLLIVNNWNAIASRYETVYASHGFLYFASFYVIAVTFCLATVTAYFVFAFQFRFGFPESETGGKCVLEEGALILYSFE